MMIFKGYKAQVRGCEVQVRWCSEDSAVVRWRRYTRDKKCSTRGTMVRRRGYNGTMYRGAMVRCSGRNGTM